MKKLLLICDEYIYFSNGNYYAGSPERLDFLCRYVRVFDKVRLALRCIEEQELKSHRALINNPKVEVFPIPIFHGPKEYALNYFKIGKELRNVTEGCDAAVLRLPSTIAQRAYKWVVNAGIPYATEIVFDANDGKDTASNLLEKILWGRIDGQMRNICYKADGVSCVTEKYLQKRYFSKKASHFESHYSTLALNKSFFSSPRNYPNYSPLTIAHVDLQIGLHSRKGTDIIIQALEKLKIKNIIVNVKFAGEDWDNSTEAILSFAKEHNVDGQVQCVGFLTREKLDRFLNESDLFVLPTKAEGLPRVIIEAIAKGLPTITTPASGNPELIPSEYLVNFYDVDTLADRIETLVTNKKAYEDASKINYEHSLQYEASILEKRRDEFYTELLKKCK
ncbi:MAG: glycosyltransferase [Bacteroidales bacterium]|jgi:glycosyltransferase involved in cell wall biosynthesis|nr:glycosyltransferase [Bacteroidales bacterium]